LKAVAEAGGWDRADELMYFGLGTEKAASTWIARYLVAHPQVGGFTRPKGHNGAIGRKRTTAAMLGG
jgi:hypothetical protein